MLFVTSENGSLLLPVSLQRFYHLIVAISEEFPNAQAALLLFVKESFKISDRRETASVSRLHFVTANM